MKEIVTPLEPNELQIQAQLRAKHSSCKALFVIYRGLCEGCDNAARHEDSEGVPLCCRCMAELEI